VLTNLIANAIRYSFEDSKIIASVEQRDKTVVFSVQDFGKGIDSKYKDRIFDRYFRVPGTKEEGTGLGLAICREFIEAQGGKIWVESDYGDGSKFSFWLPVA
jgi:signal transduction histidine kinase